MAVSEIAQRPNTRSQGRNRYRSRLTDTLTRKRSLVQIQYGPPGRAPGPARSGRSAVVTGELPARSISGPAHDP
jgi:hypothetical protein